MVQVNNRLFVRSRKMLKQKDKDSSNERVEIKEEDSAILQSLPAASSAHTYSKQPPTNSKLPRWDLGLVNRNLKLKRVKQFCKPQTRPSFNSTEQPSPRVYHPWQSFLSSSSYWGSVTRKTGGAIKEPEGQSCTTSCTPSTALPNHQNRQGKDSRNTRPQSQDLGCPPMSFPWLPT